MEFQLDHAEDVLPRHKADHTTTINNWNYVSLFVVDFDPSMKSV